APGVLNFENLTTLTNNGAISSDPSILNYSAIVNYGFIGSLNNLKGATIVGGQGAGGVHNEGVFGAGSLATLTNSGTIAGGAGGPAAGSGGAGVSNFAINFDVGSRIGTLTNNGEIVGGLGGDVGGAGGAGVQNFASSDTPTPFVEITSL